MKHIQPIPEAHKTPCSLAGRLESMPVPGYATATVYLPTGYDAEKAYPVFYLLHGGGGNEHAFFSEDGELKNMLDHLIAEGRLAPLLVVAPTYYPDGTREKTPAMSGIYVRDFIPVLTEKIIPLVEQRYAVIPDRMHRAIGGFSMGGVATWYALLNGTAAFYWYMPLSGDCWVCGEKGGGDHAEETASILADTLRGKDFRIHALTGDQDIAYPNLNPQMTAMRKYPEVFGDKIEYSVLPGGVHDYETIRIYLYNALPALFGA